MVALNPGDGPAPRGAEQAPTAILSSLAVLVCLVCVILGIKFRWFRKSLTFSNTPPPQERYQPREVIAVSTTGVYRQTMDAESFQNYQPPRVLPPIKERPQRRPVLPVPRRTSKESDDSSRTLENPASQYPQPEGIILLPKEESKPKPLSPELRPATPAANGVINQQTSNGTIPKTIHKDTIEPFMETSSSDEDDYPVIYRREISAPDRLKASPEPLKQTLEPPKQPEAEFKLVSPKKPENSIEIVDEKPQRMLAPVESDPNDSGDETPEEESIKRATDEIDEIIQIEEERDSLEHEPESPFSTGDIRSPSPGMRYAKITKKRKAKMAPKPPSAAPEELQYEIQEIKPKDETPNTPLDDSGVHMDDPETPESLPVEPDIIRPLPRTRNPPSTLQVESEIVKTPPPRVISIMYPGEDEITIMSPRSSSNTPPPLPTSPPPVEDAEDPDFEVDGSKLFLNVQRTQNRKVSFDNVLPVHVYSPVESPMTPITPSVDSAASTPRLDDDDDSPDEAYENWDRVSDFKVNMDAANKHKLRMLNPRMAVPKPRKQLSPIANQAFFEPPPPPPPPRRLGGITENGEASERERARSPPVSQTSRVLEEIFNEEK